MSDSASLPQRKRTMTPRRSKLSNEKGMVLVYMAGAITVLLLFSGLAVDTGRIYIVKAQLTKALDGAALGAARNMNSGNPTAEAQRIFNANFPANFFGATLTSGPTVSVTTDAGSGRNIVDVSASASLPTTFMRLGNFTTMNVNASAEATRRMVDVSLILDVSGSIGPAWPTVRDAARSFIDSFDAAHDRVALSTFSNGATVIDQMPSSRGFNKTQVEADVPGSLPGGSTNMAEGLYRGWDELRSVPSGTQSGLRVIVLLPTARPTACLASTTFNLVSHGRCGPRTFRSLRPIRPARPRITRKSPVSTTHRAARWWAQGAARRRRSGVPRRRSGGS